MDKGGILYVNNDMKCEWVQSQWRERLELKKDDPIT